MQPPLPWLKGWDRPIIADHPLRVLGIDLGTTVSTVTEIVWDPASDQPPIAQVLEIPQATLDGEIVHDLVPSVVATWQGQEYVGAGAHRMRSSPQVQLARNASIWWETKDEIGTRRRYPKAPEGYQTPQEIAARILGFLHQAALDDPQPIDQVVITVPASFQLSQRSDTLQAAQAAGLEIAPGGLFDEPVAAFLDYLTQNGAALVAGRELTRVLVMDFGGGTADVALLQVKSTADGGLHIARKGVSRFHAIGGADIDDVLALEVLYPALLAENGIPAFALSYKHKRDYVLPALTSIAEQLKKKLSIDAAQRIRLGSFDENDPLMGVSLPGVMQVHTGHPDHPVAMLTQPRLTLAQLRKATDRFLSRFVLEPEQGEYFTARSIFAPIRDCLARAQWTPSHVDAVLLVGGSSLFYEVPRQIGAYFPDADLLTYGAALDAQRCVGRGAAYQALLLAAYGHSPLQSMISDGVAIVTNSGPKTVIEPGSALPYPADGDWRTVGNLALVNGSPTQHVPLQVAFTSGEARLASEVMQVAPPSAPGDPIEVSLRIDANQVLQFRVAVRSGDRTQEFSARVDNPLSVVSNPNAKRDRIMEIEELLPGAPAAQQATFLDELIELHRELREFERARQLLEGRIAAAAQGERARLYFRLAMVCGELGDREAQIACYKQALALGFDPAAAFNLALALRKEGQLDQALEIIDIARSRRPGRGTDEALAGLIQLDLGRAEDAAATMTRAIGLFPEPSSCTDHELSWLLIAARHAPDKDLADAVRAEQARRQGQGGAAADQGIDGPDLPDWIE